MGYNKGTDKRVVTSERIEWLVERLRCRERKTERAQDQEKPGDTSLVIFNTSLFHITEMVRTADETTVADWPIPLPHALRSSPSTPP